MEKLKLEETKLRDERITFRENNVRKEASAKDIDRDIRNISNDIQSIHPPSDEWAEKETETIEGDVWKEIFSII